MPDASSTLSKHIAELMERPYHTVDEITMLNTELRGAIEKQKTEFTKVNRESLALWFLNILTGRELYTKSGDDEYSLSTFTKGKYTKWKPIEEVTTEDQDAEGYDDSGTLVEHLREELKNWEGATKEATGYYDQQVQVKTEVSDQLRLMRLYSKDEQGIYSETSFDTDY